MSYSERKAILFLLFLNEFIREGHLRIYGEAIETKVSYLLNLYSGSGSKKDINKLNKAINIAKDEIINSGVKSTSIMMLAFVIFTADLFTEKVKGERFRAWIELKKIAEYTKVRKYVGSEGFKKSYAAEYDKANLLIEIIERNSL